MQFSDTTNNSGIIQETERLINMGYGWVSGDTTRLKEFTTITNNSNSDVWSLIFFNSNNWVYDDSNQTDLPHANGDFTNGTFRYSLPTTALTVKRIEIADEVGNYTIARAITEEEIPIALSELYDGGGIPRLYRLVGNTIEFYPTPNYTTTSNTGFKVYFDRENVAFSTSDTTKTPGFASPYHRILAYKNAISWLSVKQPQSPSLSLYLKEEQKLELSIAQFYKKRNKNHNTRLTRLTKSYK